MLDIRNYVLEEKKHGMLFVCLIKNRILKARAHKLTKKEEKETRKFS